MFSIQDNTHIIYMVISYLMDCIELYSSLIILLCSLGYDSVVISDDRGMLVYDWVGEGRVG